MMPVERPDLLAELSKRSGQETRFFKRKQIICGHGSCNEPEIHLIMSGSAMIKALDIYSSREVGLDIVRPEQVVGLESLIDPSASDPHPILVRAAEDCSTMSWNVEEIEILLERNRCLAIALRNAVIEQYLRFLEKIVQFATMNVAQRLASFF